MQALAQNPADTYTLSGPIFWNTAGKRLRVRQPCLPQNSILNIAVVHMRNAIGEHWDRGEFQTATKVFKLWTNYEQFYSLDL